MSGAFGIFIIIIYNYCNNEFKLNTFPGNHGSGTFKVEDLL